jgi:2-polyprenyl-3-methyl-5-hydroxy-6-metoxy-1,4-benzoquinol methylase
MVDKQTTLQHKHHVERHFYDSKASSEHGAKDRDFYVAGGANLTWNSYLGAVGDLRGKRVLDFGCGEGWCALEYARRGANVFSFDISSESLALLSRDIKRLRLSNQIHAAVMAAEFLGYSTDTFDLVLGWSILHHTDLQYVRSEVFRVLKPGGRALFVEPLAHNLLLRAFRKLTPQRRTPTEQPMTISQINDFGTLFSSVKFHGYHLFSIFPQGLLWATGSKWLFQCSLSVCETFDKWLLRLFPSLHRYCWSAIIEIVK